ncbi:hypothetical protein M0802_005390 [Mischocyttarus mexicanus]|nr:hypothetical protein M0802_005390 [Mischocyttarus mexicanus]
MKTTVKRTLRRTATTATVSDGGDGSGGSSGGVTNVLKTSVIATVSILHRYIDNIFQEPTINGVYGGARSREQNRTVLVFAFSTTTHNTTTTMTISFAEFQTTLTPV